MGAVEDIQAGWNKLMSFANTDFFVGLNNFLNNINYTAGITGNLITTLSGVNDKIGWYIGSIGSIITRPIESLGYQAAAITTAWTGAAHNFGGLLTETGAWFTSTPMPAIIGLAVGLILAVVLPDIKLKMLGAIGGGLTGYLVSKMAGL